MSHDEHDQAASPKEPVVKAFKILIDKVPLETKNPSPTGRELLTLASKVPVEQHAIYLRIKEGQPQRIGLDEHVDLTRPGVERFVTLPLDQTEG
jgi:hypothetical protein